MNIEFSKQKLIDKSKTGKVRPWKEKKKDNLIYARYLKKLNFKKAENVRHCGEFLTFKKEFDGHFRLYQTFFCKSKLCPMCNWRRSLKASSQLKEIFEVATKKNSKARFLFLTLTQENSTGQDLKQDIKAMNKALHKFLAYKKIAKNLLGYVRSFEITVNDSDLESITYHPHLHLILFVRPEYFSDQENYLEQKDWTNLWQRALKVSYTPVVNIKAVKSKSKIKNDKDSLLKAAQETAKYQVKSSEILTGDEDRDLQVIDNLEHALDYTRQISFGGIFKEIRKELQLDNCDDGNLINVSKDSNEINDNKCLVFAKWNYRKQDYYILESSCRIYLSNQNSVRRKKCKRNQVDVLIS